LLPPTRSFSNFRSKEMTSFKFPLCIFYFICITCWQH
jgi:hypothetical protein